MDKASRTDAKLIRKEQVNGILQQSPTNVVANSIVVVLSYWGFRQVGEPIISNQSIWLVIMLLISAIQWIEITRFKRKGLTDEYRQRLLIGSTAVALIIGIGWSLFVLFFIGSDVEFVYLMTALICGLIAGSVASTSIYLPLFFLFTFPFIATFIYQLIALDSSRLLLLAILLLAFYLMCSNMAYILNKREIESFALRFENLDVLEKLKEQKLIAENANIAKSKFLAATSHDLRQPLHALGFFIDALKATPDNKSELFSKIDSSMSSLEGLFDSLLDISRLDAGVIPVSLQDFSLQTIFENLKNEFEEDATQNKLLLDFERCHNVVHSDPDLLKRLLGNLISNAIRYTEQGKINVEVNTKGADCLISVSDTGIGISAKNLKHVFDEFHQINNPERDRRKGLGLGLAIVKKLAKLLGAKLSVRSEVEKGSRFAIQIPKGDPKNIESQPEKRTYQNRELFNRKILLIDDEIDIRKAMEYSLSNWGCEVVCCESELDAINKIESLAFDYELIISDLRLRENKNGIDAIQSIFKKTGKITPAMLVSGDTTPQSITDAQKSGFRLLHKPLKPAELRLNLINLLENMYS